MFVKRPVHSVNQGSSAVSLPKLCDLKQFVVFVKKKNEQKKPKALC